MPTYGTAALQRNAHCDASIVLLSSKEGHIHRHTHTPLTHRFGGSTLSLCVCVYIGVCVDLNLGSASITNVFFLLPSQHVSSSSLPEFLVITHLDCQVACKAQLPAQRRVIVVRETIAMLPLCRHGGPQWGLCLGMWWWSGGRMRAVRVLGGQRG